LLYYHTFHGIARKKLKKFPLFSKASIPGHFTLSGGETGNYGNPDSGRRFSPPGPYAKGERFRPETALRCLKSGPLSVDLIKQLRAVFYKKNRKRGKKYPFFKKNIKKC